VTWLFVIAGAMLGAPARYLTDRAIQRRHDTVFPWGTFTVNVAGCLVLGLVTGAATHGVVSTSATALVGVGFCGALTTYSTFAYETLRLTETGARLFAVANLTLSVVVGIGAMVLGSVVADALWTGR
jgi:CrcB protein